MQDVNDKEAPAGAGRPNSGSVPGFAQTALVALFVGLATATLAIGVYDRYFAQKIVAVDLKGYVQRQRDLLLAGKIDDEGIRRAFDRLETVLTEIPGNHVVILKEVVLRNGKDIEIEP